MNLIYWLICLLPLLVIFSEKIDTDGILRNIGLCAVSFGGMIAAMTGYADAVSMGITLLLLEKIVFHYRHSFVRFFKKLV